MLTQKLKTSFIEMCIETHPCILNFPAIGKENKTHLSIITMTLSLNRWWETIRDSFYLSRVRNINPRACLHAWVWYVLITSPSGVLRMHCHLCLSRRFGTSEETWNHLFLFRRLVCFVYYGDLQFYPISWKWYNFILLCS